jgi:hypothetical protein
VNAKKSAKGALKARMPLSAGVSFIGVNTGTIANCTSMGNQQGYLLAGGTSWNGNTIPITSHTIVDNNTAASNVGGGFVDEQNNAALHNVFINNVALNNTPNYSFTAATIAINNN